MTSESVALEGKSVDALDRYAAALGGGRGQSSPFEMLVQEVSTTPTSGLEGWEARFRALEWQMGSSRGISSWFQARPPVEPWIGLCAASGFRRERALKALNGGAPNRLFMALLFRRLNDWVDQVRQAALECIRRVGPLTDPAILADACCATLTHWQSWGRITDAERSAFMELAASESILKGVKEKILASPNGPMSLPLAQISRSSEIDRYMAEIAQQATQPWVRARATRALLSGRVVSCVGREWKWTSKQWCEGRLMPVLEERELTQKVPFVSTLEMAACDVSPIVRRVAAEFVIREIGALGVTGVSLAKRLAADASPSVAERGRFALRATAEQTQV